MATTNFRRRSWTVIRWNVTPEIHAGVCAWDGGRIEAAEAGLGNPAQLQHRFHTQAPAGLYCFLDFPADGGFPVNACRIRCSSMRGKRPCKKSIFNCGVPSIGLSLGAAAGRVAGPIPAADGSVRGRDLARPFWLELPWPEETEERCWAGITVAATGDDWFPSYLQCLRGAGQAIRGVGPLSYRRCEEAARVVLPTPLRARHHGKAVGRESLTGEILIHAVTGRIQSLLRAAGEANWDGANWVMGLTKGLEGDRRRLRQEDFTRYSARQVKELEMGGVRGELVLDLRERAGLWPVLWAGQWLHCGRGTTPGLGRYSVEAA